MPRFPSSLPLLDTLERYGIRPSVCIADKGYDVAPFYDGCELRGIRPVAPLRMTPFVKAGKAAPPKCDHGVVDLRRFRCQAGRGQVPLPLG